MNKKLYDEAFDIKKLKEETTYVSACFAAGTLVHTDKGLIPIQDIKVGDKVLSRDEHHPNGELCYKSVLKTVKTPNQEVFRFTYCAEDQYDVIESNLSYVIATKDHPFWNNTEGRWCPTIDMPSGARILLANQGDMKYYFLANNQIYQTCNSKGVFFGYCDNPLSETSPIQMKSIFEITSELVISYFNPLTLETFKPNNGSSLNYEERSDIAKYAEGKALLCDVYNIEVEDYHTYFVGEEGVWVHNTNCVIEQLPYIQSQIPSDVAIRNPERSDPLPDYVHYGLHANASREQVLKFYPNPENGGLFLSLNRPGFIGDRFACVRQHSLTELMNNGRYSPHPLRA